MNSQIGQYSVVRFVPSPGRQEHINIGIILQGPEYLNWKLETPTGRINKVAGKRLDRQVKNIAKKLHADLSQRQQEDPEEEFLMDWYQDSWMQLQLSEPTPIQGPEWDKRLEMLWSALVKDPAQKDGGRGRQVHTNQIRSRVSDALDNRGLIDDLESNYEFGVGAYNFIVDFANPAAHLIIKAVPVASQNEGYVFRRAKEWAWNFGHVIANNGYQRGSIWSVVPAWEEIALESFDEVERILSEVSNIVHAEEEELHEWASTIEKHLASEGQEE